MYRVGLMRKNDEGTETTDHKGECFHAWVFNLLLNLLLEADQTGCKMRGVPHAAVRFFVIVARQQYSKTILPKSQVQH